MKIWVTASSIHTWVDLHIKRPSTFLRGMGYMESVDWVSRIGIKKLLKGTGKKLPSYGSKTILELELTIKGKE